MMQKILMGALCLAASAGVAQAQGGKKSAAGTPIDAPECKAVDFQDGAMVCRCPADGSNGSVWGSGPYTADSDICTAARHAGAIDLTGGVVRLLERPGQDSYSGSFSNGVTTSDWGSYGQSYAFAGTKPTVTSALPACAKLPEGLDEYACQCPANPVHGSVWGNGPYTADSDICSAALHAGYIDTDGGVVHVLRVQGLSGYLGGEGGGVTTSGWGSYEASIIFDWNR